MTKYILIFVLFALLFVLLPAGFYFLSYSQTTPDNKQKIKYDLPYPGILPDNPLFFVKSGRDQILELITRDNIKKASLYLLLSDKKLVYALSLEKKGKEKLAVKNITEAEEDFRKIKDFLIAAKKEGKSPEDDFALRVRLSNEKHREIIGNLMKEFPKDQSDALTSVLQLNEQIAKEIKSL